MVAGATILANFRYISNNVCDSFIWFVLQVFEIDSLIKTCYQVFVDASLEWLLKWCKEKNLVIAF